jgi:arsenite-transporting ATPase
VAELGTLFPELPVRVCPERPREPRGVAALGTLARSLSSPHRGPAVARGRRSPPAGAGLPASAGAPPAWLDELVPSGLRLVLFGGKGGVGKTTCAAAVALHVARARPSSEVLLLSADPAHSLADVLALSGSLGEPRVPWPALPNLRVHELDAAARHEAWRRSHARRIGELLDALLAPGIDVPFDRAVLERLLEVAPPGVDEALAVVELAGQEAAAGGAERVLVLDTAPTGHTLRLLEMPALALAWDHALMRILLEYRRVVPAGDLAAELLALAAALERLRAQLADPGRCRFVPVFRPARVPLAETARLVAALDAAGIASPWAIANAVVRDGCASCAREAGEQQRLLAGLRLDRAILLAAERHPPPGGAAALVAWSEGWQR